MEELKICTRCNNSKEATLIYFGFNKSRSKFKPHCRECGRAASRQRYENNKEEIRIYDRKKSRARYQDPVKRADKNARIRQWFLDNPDKKREYTLRRKLYTTENHSDEWVHILLNDPCTYCGELTTAIDHATPVSKGGSNDVTNLTGACKSCNSSKKDKSFLEFLVERQKEYLGENYVDKKRIGR